MQTLLLHKGESRESSCMGHPVPCETAEHMASFLSLMEYRFEKMELPVGSWGNELGEYLAWNARDYGDLLRDIGTNMSDGLRRSGS